MYKNKKTGIIGSIITVIILIVLVFTTSIDTNSFSKIENVFNKLIMPFQSLYTSIKNKVLHNNNYFATIDILKQENNDLKEQNIELQAKLEELQILKSENKILKEYANLGEQYKEYDFVTAYIINKSITNLSDVFIINVGTNDGVYANMAVMGPNGLVGHTISATNNTAKVQPIIDASSNISGVTSGTRENVVVKGQIGSNKELIVNALQTDTEFFIGDTIETSGLGGIYPKGIEIGKIKEVIETKNIAEKYAIIETATDFERLEYVLVIKK